MVESLAEGEESDQGVVEDLEVVGLEDLEVAEVVEVAAMPEDQEVVVGDLEEVWAEVMVKVELEEEGQGIQEELAVPMEQVLEAVVT